jgi:effector-binding domain-containing protein
MLTLPEIVERPEQVYAYINFEVRMDQMQTPASEGFPALFAYLAQAGIAPVGAPFYNYRRIDMAETLDVEAGVPVARLGEESGNIRFGTLPAGRFVTMRWHGHPDALEQVTALLIGWVRLTQQPLDMEELPDGDHFACRLEIYESNPDDEPDMDKWVTELAFKLKD